MDEQKTTSKNVALESFWLSSQGVLSTLVGEKLASSMWVSKELEPSLDDFARKTFERFDAIVRDEIASGAKGRMRFDVHEKTVVLSPMDLLDRGRALARKTMEEEGLVTGFGDIDWTMERILTNGAEMGEIHSASSFKEKLSSLFSPEGFDTLEPLYRPLGEPLCDLVREMDKDMEIGVSGGMRNPYSATCSVGVIVMELERADGSKMEVPLLRRQKTSDFHKVALALHDEVEAIRKELCSANIDLQERLRHLPKDWPTVEVYGKARSLAERRFNGDNGLGQSDFYDGSWGKVAMLSEIHVEASESHVSDVGCQTMPQKVDFAKKRGVAWKNTDIGDNCGKPPRI